MKPDAPTPKQPLFTRAQIERAGGVFPPPQVPVKTTELSKKEKAERLREYRANYTRAYRASLTEPERRAARKKALARERAARKRRANE